jgi:glycosyltransferase involved in cell wall biosynthesis
MTLQSKRVLYISYNGMLEPLGQSQVIPYLIELSKLGVRFTLLSFERRNAFTSEGVERTEALNCEWLDAGIDWHRLRYHQSPSLPATGFDVLHGVRKAAQLVRQNAIEMVHARSHIPAMIAMRLKQQFGIKMIFDVRGLMADEYVDAEHWRKNSLPYRMTKLLERKALSTADGIVTLTEKIWPLISESNGLSDGHAIHEVVPCCADLRLFRFDQLERERLRAELGIDDRFVIVYSGSIDGWYLTEKMADFFRSVKRNNSGAYFLWLTRGNHERVNEVMTTRDLVETDYKILSLDPASIPAYLSASDAGLAFIKPCFSKMASSPTKYAEYLACGLPLIINSGIGDSDSLIRDENVGALVESFDDSEYLRAAAVIEQLNADRHLLHARTRGVAERLFDVRTIGAQRYARLYERVLTMAN